MNHQENEHSIHRYSNKPHDDLNINTKNKPQTILTLMQEIVYL